MTDRLLKNQNLMNLVLEHTESEGVTGNHKAKKHVLLACASTYNANLESVVHLILEQEPGIGKSTLAKSIINLFPEDRVKTYSHLSRKALNHMSETLDRKIIFIEELSGNEANYSLKIAMSEHKLTSGTVEKHEGAYTTQNKKVSVEGTSFITTTTSKPSDKELESRVLRVYTDNSVEYKSDVLDTIKSKVRQKSLPQPEQGYSVETFRQAFSKLEVHEVIIPFVDDIVKNETFIQIPDIFRRTNIILAKVQAHALLHQKQREVIDGCLIAIPEDYMNIRDLLEDIFNPNDPELKKLKEHVGDEEFHVKDVERCFDIKKSYAYIKLNELRDRGLITQTGVGKYKCRTIVLPELEISPHVPHITGSPENIQNEDFEHHTKTTESEDTQGKDSSREEEESIFKRDVEKLKRHVGNESFSFRTITNSFRIPPSSAIDLCHRMYSKGLTELTGIGRYKFRD